MSVFYYNNAFGKPTERVSIGNIHYPLISWGRNKLVKQWNDPDLYQNNRISLEKSEKPVLAS